jgi:hypothetical protein
MMNDSNKENEGALQELNQDKTKQVHTSITTNKDDNL